VAVPVSRVLCRGCEQRKPRDAFEYFTDKRGARSPRKQCRICNGELGHKPCYTCKEDLPIDRFSVVRKPGALPYPRRDCKKCVYRLRKLGKAEPARKRGRPTASQVFITRPRTVGWTPPPTADQLAGVHARYSPPPGWVPIPGERCAQA
jgi:hypothetical protein